MSDEALGEDTVPEFSKSVALDSLPRGGKFFVLSASEEERAAVARRVGVPSIARLEGRVQIRATNLKIDVTGNVEASMTRICVVSLEHMDEIISEEFELEFLRHAPAHVDETSEEDWLDAPDVHDAPMIDVGELLVQQMSLAMDPFPRLPDAPNLADKYGSEQAPSPFAEALAKAVKSEENQ